MYSIGSMLCFCFTSQFCESTIYLSYLYALTAAENSGRFLVAVLYAVLARLFTSV
jgi:hypothetical protein